RDLAPGLIGLFAAMRIFYHKNRLAVRANTSEQGEAFPDAVRLVALAVVVLSVEQVFTRETVNGGAKARVFEKLLTVLRNHKELLTRSLHPRRDRGHESHHLVLVPHQLELIDLVEIESVETGRDNPIGITKDDLLPLRIPEVHGVVSPPLPVLLAEPRWRPRFPILVPVRSIGFGFTDAEISNDQPP